MRYVLALALWLLSWPSMAIQGLCPELVQSELQPRDGIRAEALAPGLAPERRLVIGFEGNHTYLFFQGYRIDSFGVAGLRVRSELRRARHISGDLAVILYDLSDEDVHRIRAAIQSFEHKSALTCVALTCSYIRTVSDERVLKRSALSASGLLRSLLRAREAGERVEFISLTGEPLTEIQANLRAQDLTTASGIAQNTFYAAAVIGVVALLLNQALN